MPKRSKKIYYIPGIISLLFLPLLFNFFSHQNTNKLTRQAIPIAWADSSYFEKHAGLFNKFPPKRLYLEILLTGSKAEDEISLGFSQLKIRQILSQADSVNGIHFIFTDTAEYGTFIKTIDILRQEKAKSYLPYGRDLWFFYSARRPVDTTKQIKPLDL